MIGNIKRVLVLVLGLAVCCARAQQPEWQRPTLQTPSLPDLTKIKKVCGDPYRHVEFTAAEVLDGMYPDPGVLLVSQTCKEQAQALREKWMREDLAGFDQLANRACSAALGWVEKVPGTCQAGGPPPICPRDHWERRPFDAQDQWKEHKKKIWNDRLEKMAADACACHLKELKGSQAAVVHPIETASLKAKPRLAVPCKSDADCPPGYRCMDGICRPLNTGEQFKEAVKEKLKDKATEAAGDKILEEAVKAISAKLAEILATMSGRIVVGTVAGILDPKPLSTWKDGYERHSKRFFSHCEDLVKLNDEMSNFNRGLPARGPDIIGAEIKRIKAALVEDVRNLNIDYMGILREKEMGKCGCEGVLTFQHQTLMQAFANVMSHAP